jgi:hypothetical protein
MGYIIYTHEIHTSYAERIDNFRSFDTVNKDIIQRWTHPMVPDVLSFGNCLDIKLHRQGIYKASGTCNVDLAGLFLEHIPFSLCILFLDDVSIKAKYMSENLV